MEATLPWKLTETACCEVTRQRCAVCGAPVCGRLGRYVALPLGSDSDGIDHTVSKRDYQNL